MQKMKHCNCSNCVYLIKGRLCKKLSTLINERDMQGDLKCKYHAFNQEKSKEAMGAGK